MIDFELLESDISCLLVELDYKRISSVDESIPLAQTKATIKDFIFHLQAHKSKYPKCKTVTTVSNTITIFILMAMISQGKKAKFQVMNDIFKIGRE